MLHWQLALRWLRVLAFALGLTALAPAVVARVWTNLGYLQLAAAVMPSGAYPRPAAQYEPPRGAERHPMARAEALFRRALVWSPADGRAEVGLAQSLIWAGRPAEAVESLAAASAPQPQPNAKFVLGNAHLFAGQHDQALAAWMAATPTLLAREQLAIILFGQSSWGGHHPERWWDAVDVLNGTLQQPGLVSADRMRLNLQLATLYQHMGELALAEQAVRDGLAVVPHDASAQAALAWILLSQGDRVQAQVVAEAARLQHAGWPAYYVLGEVALQSCRIAEAITAFQTGLQYPVTEYRFYWQWLRLGDAYWEAAQPAEAIAHWETYHQYQPNDAQVSAKIDLARHGQLERNCPLP
jgi:tetratricopeptide (TPR) repeat protein